MTTVAPITYVPQHLRSQWSCRVDYAVDVPKSDSFHGILSFASSIVEDKEQKKFLLTQLSPARLSLCTQDSLPKRVCGENAVLDEVQSFFFRDLPEMWLQDFL